MLFFTGSFLAWVIWLMQKSNKKVNIFGIIFECHFAKPESFMCFYN